MLPDLNTVDEGDGFNVKCGGKNRLWFFRNERIEVITNRNSWTAVNGRVGDENRNIIRLLNRSSLRQLVSCSSFDGGKTVENNNDDAIRRYRTYALPSFHIIIIYFSSSKYLRLVLCLITSTKLLILIRRSTRYLVPN